MSFLSVRAERGVMSGKFDFRGGFPFGAYKLYSRKDALLPPGKDVTLMVMALSPPYSTQLVLCGLSRGKRSISTSRSPSHRLDGTEPAVSRLISSRETESTATAQLAAAGPDHSQGFADFLNLRGDDGRAVLGVMKLQMHAAADVAKLEHGASPRRAGDRYLHWLRTILRVSRNQRRTVAQKLRRIEVMPRTNMKHGVGRQTFEKYASLDFGLDDVAIDLVPQVGMRREH